MDVDTVLEIFRQIAGEIRSGLDGLDDWGLSGGHPGQYVHDVVADEIAIPISVSYTHLTLPTKA